jgi:hypothetical protein
MPIILTSSVLHTLITSSLRLNLQAIDVDDKENEAGEELLSVVPPIDTLNPLKNFLS